MISRKPLYVQQPPSFVFLGVTMQIHLSGVQTGGEFSLIGATMPPGGDGGLHLHTREDESVHLWMAVGLAKRRSPCKPGRPILLHEHSPPAEEHRSCSAARCSSILGTFDKFVQMAGTRRSGRSWFPDPEQMQRLLALAEEFGVKILVSPDLRTRN